MTEQSVRYVEGESLSGPAARLAKKIVMKLYDTGVVSNANLAVAIKHAELAVEDAFRQAFLDGEQNG